MAAPRVRLEPVWQHFYGELMTGPGWRRIRCPEHQDRNASAQVNTDTGKWTCFTCDLSEDAIDIIMRKENLSFGSALLFAEERLGEVVEEVRPSRGRSGRVSRRTGTGEPSDQQLTLGSRTRRRT